jgi:hypothetical protein
LDLIAAPDAIDRARQRLSGLPSADRDQALAALQTGIEAAQAGDNEKLLQSTVELQAIVIANPPNTSPTRLRPGGGRGGPVKCYDRCKDKLSSGNAPGYAVCWYACLIAGGDI